ncbi:MAG TPA: ParM/StbA family protein [Ktedonobacteraceae bacterium]|nr:ParM/StbA family protein [Ktedonobacteraceae bacterium]
MINTDTSSIPQEQTETMQWYAYGYDFGNSEIDAVLLKPNPAKERTDILSKSTPTAFTQLNTTVLKSMGVNTDTALIIRMQEEQASYGIGSVALVQSTDPWSGRGDLQRYASRYSLRALLAMSGSMVPDKEYGLLVVSGLPAETYQKNPGLRKDIKAALTGKWTFTLDGGKTWRTCHVEVALTIMEGAGALIAYGGPESSQMSAVIDIGGRTTDLYVARGQTPVIEYCTGKPIGVESAAKMLINSFESKYGFPLTPLEARGIMHTFAEANATELPPPTRGKKKQAIETPTTLVALYPEISVQGNLVPSQELEGYVLEAVRQTTDDIVSFVAAAWRQTDTSSVVAARFHPVLNIGGGVFYFFKALKARIPHLTRPSDPTHANALGYARAAEQLLEKKRKPKT